MEPCERPHAPRTPDRRAFVRGVTLVLGGVLGVCADASGGTRTSPWPALAALLEAVDAGKADVVRELLERRPALAGAVGDDGVSIFLRAHLRGHAEVGAAIRAHLTELDFVETLAAGEYETFKEMASADPDRVRAVHPAGGTPYYVAALLGNSKMMWPLNRNGGDPNAQPFGAARMSPVRAAFECPDPDRAARAALRMLTDAGDPTVPQPNGDSVLHAAVRLGELHVIRTVLRKGGDPHAANTAGRTPLDLAREGDDPEIVRLLETPGAVPLRVSTSRFAHLRDGDAYERREVDLPREAVDAFGEVCHYDFDRVRSILREHPDVVHAVATWDEMGVEATAHMGRRDMAEHLLERGAPLSLPTAIAMRERALATRMLEEDPSRIHERGPHDFALMWYPGIGGESVEMAELLLSFGADINEEKFGTTLLHRAAANGHTDLVRLLLERGADVHGVGRSDFSDLEGTPLAWARANEREETAALLAGAGARQ